MNNFEKQSEFIPVAKPFIWGTEVDNVLNVIEAGWLTSYGGVVDRFEKQVASYLGIKHGIAVMNGTAALHLALECLGIGDGDEVIVPNFTMMAPIFAVLYCGAKPIPVDVDDTWNIDPELIEEVITPNTKAIIIVHTYGHSARLSELTQIARQNNLYIIEDIAEALGTTYNSQYVGTFGDISCISFYANKILTTGEGGMLLTNNSNISDLAQWKRNMCFGDGIENRFTHREIGFNYRLTSMQAALGLAQLEHIEAAIDAKIHIARQYNDYLQGLSCFQLPPNEPWCRNIYWMYGIVIEPTARITRKDLQDQLLECGIETRRFFTPLDQQPFFESNIEATFAVSHNLAENGFYLPSFIGLTSSQVAFICNSIQSIIL